MSTPSVSRYYNTRKRDLKIVRDLKLPQSLPTVSEGEFVKANVEKVVPNVKTVNIPNTEKDIVNLQKREISKSISGKKKVVPAIKDKKSIDAKADKKSKSKQPTLTNFFGSETDNLKSCGVKPKKEAKAKNIKIKNCYPCVTQPCDSSTESEKPFQPAISVKETRLPQSPKRNLPIPGDEGTPSKKKPLLEVIVTSENDASVSQTVDKFPKSKVTARRKLELNSLESKSCPIVHSPNAKNTDVSPKKLLRTPDKLDALIDQSRSKLLLSPRLGELKKSLALFSEKTSKLKEFQSNPYKITSVISSKSPVKTSALPPVFACERFKHLTEPDPSSLVLPFKYKILSEMFRSMDTVVGMLNNRKEKITFEKVREGVQKIMKRKFSEIHLGQIVTVLPSAYSLSREKCSYISKKNDSLDYQLVISPNLISEEDSNKKSTGFLLMHPPCLIDRTNEFNRNLLEMVKKHHQDFLTRINFVTVSKDSINQWHPKFPVDSVPDIPIAPLPESPEMKIYTAKDVLNKFKGSLRNKVEKALQSVTDESEKSDVTLELKEISNPKPDSSKSALKGICSDLLEKIRARESAKLLETMTRSPTETKRQAMMERIPKIVKILWHYFIAERKAAVPVDTAVEKIIYSFNSLSTPDEVKEHLKLITEIFPDWLTFKKIPKGVYIMMDKKKNINEMLDNAGLH